jgi:hypothetical protein
MNEEVSSAKFKTEVLKKFKKLDTSDFPEFYEYVKPLDRGLWILWVAKEKLDIKKMTSRQIALIIKEVKEININEKSITYSFNATSSEKVCNYEENGEVYFEIMKPGKDYLISQTKEKSINLLYFKPGEHYKSKRLLSKSILTNLKGELSIVDPYCDERTLDILSDIKNKVVRFLTKTDYLQGNKKSRFLRDYKDFKLEHPKIEFKDYPHKDIHDRYIISDNLLVILGHSIKDLGAKESFAIVLYKDKNINISDSLIESFNRRWKQSNIL